MFFNFPPLTLGEGDDVTEIRLFSTRQTDDDQCTNFDFANVRTGVDTEDEKVTYFGIQGRSDHLSEALGQRGSKSKSAMESIRQSRRDSDASTEATPA